MDDSYLEIREHELRKTQFVMVDGRLIVKTQTSEAGTSSRAHRSGYWGFASMPGLSEAGRVRVEAKAMANAAAMSKFGARELRHLPGGTYVGEHVFQGRPALSPAECLDRIDELHAWCASRYAKVRSIRLQLFDEHHAKRLTTSRGGQSLASIQRATCSVIFVAEDADGAPLELAHRLSTKGSLADLQFSPAHCAGSLDALYEHLMAKRDPVDVRGGLQTVVVAPEVAGILAHEAMGHPCEADYVLGGAVTRDLAGTRVASALVNMVDLANTYEGDELLVPVYADDEGVQASDVALIRDGVLCGFMHSRETAAAMAVRPTGNARAYGPSDEPLVRMRNTAILPGTDKLDAMIEGVDDGYLVLKTSNGQADSTTEFMFGVNLAYEIRHGKVGRAVRDTTLSGSAIQVLQSVDAVSDELSWTCSGLCGKKQPMVVSMGGPALRAKAKLGGR